MEEFNYPSEDDEVETTINSNLQKVTHKHGIRATCWYFCSTWTLRYERNTAAETLAVRKEKTISEFKMRLITMMQDLLAKMNFICIFINFELANPMILGFELRDLKILRHIGMQGYFRICHYTTEC